MKASDVVGLLHPRVGKPERVPLGSLKVAPERFQVRNTRALTFVQGVLKDQDSKALLTSLFAVLEAGRTLDPPIIWADSRGAQWVIDGHHRVEAMREHGIAAGAMVWVQRCKVPTEAAALAIALEINVKDHLNLHKDEAINTLWHRMLCGDVVGSVRGLAAEYRVSPSTIQRMNSEKAPVLDQLRTDAKDDGKRFSRTFILTHAPTWKERSTWRDGPEQAPTDGRERATVERLLKAFTVRFAKDAKARPAELLQAFSEFFSEATGRAIEVRREASKDEQQEF